MLTTNKILAVFGSIGIGAGAGAAVGWVINGLKGALLGASAGAVGSALFYFLSTRSWRLKMDKGFYILGTLAILGCGLMAGFFFSFSTLVMPSLARQPQAAGMAVMQTINVVVFNPWFALAFIGTPVACALAMIYALLQWREPGSSLILMGGAFYLAGTLLVTLFFNVPRNDALAAVNVADPGAARLWANYLSTWTAWNHVRTAGAFAGMASLVIGFLLRASQR